MSYHFDFGFLKGSAGPLLEGLKVTIELALAANVMGLVLGFLLCLMVMSRWTIVRWPAQLFIEFFCCTPALLQIAWFFYCISMMVNVFIDPVGRTRPQSKPHCVQCRGVPCRRTGGA